LAGAQDVLASEELRLARNDEVVEAVVELWVVETLGAEVSLGAEEELNWQAKKAKETKENWAKLARGISSGRSLGKKGGSAARGGRPVQKLTSAWQGASDCSYQVAAMRRGGRRTRGARGKDRRREWTG
jgi:hypothetical protein